jgi:hypothetical protein
MHELLIFVIGLVGGWLGEKFVLDKISIYISKADQKRKYKKINTLWTRYQGITPCFELILHGWVDNIFEETEVEITIEKTFILENEIKEVINFEEKEKKWVINNLTNNELIGVSKIDAFRLTENLDNNLHKLHISAQKYSYFDFLSTGRIFFNGTSEDKKSIQDFIIMDGYLPQPKFPNPLSVGLTVFCQKGTHIIFGKRSQNSSSGGDWAASKWFNAVGENANISDINGYYRGFSTISPWITAKRGLYEELGFAEEVSNSNIKLHSLIYDNRVLDYKFFGYFISDLSVEQVKQTWKEKSIDKEHTELQIVDVSTKKKCKELIKRIVEDRDNWAMECIFSTSRSLLFMGKLSIDELLEIVDSQRS